MRDDQSQIQLVVTRPGLLKLFDITGLTEVFRISSSLDEALARA
jgi:anti-anti-sigma regulatory factor